MTTRMLSMSLAVAGLACCSGSTTSGLKPAAPHSPPDAAVTRHAPDLATPRPAPDLTAPRDLGRPDERARRTAVTVSEPEFVQFAAGSARLTRASRAVLDRMARMIKSGARGGTIRIEGHADRAEKGKAVLSLQRARAVRRYLIKRGCEASSLRAVGLASTSPLAPSSSREGRRQNRRVNFTFQEGY